MKAMITKKSSKTLKYIRTHHIGLLAIATALLLSIGVLTLRSVTAVAEIAKNTTDTQKMTEAADVKLAAIKAQKVAAEKAAKEQAEAYITAERAKTADELTAGLINPKTCNHDSAHNNPAAIDVIVNKQHCMQPLTYAPSDLVTTNGASLSAKAASNFNRMYEAAAAAGQGFYVTSSYRSYSSQVSTYNHWVSISGQEGADTYSARPGYSEHQTGFVIDVAANGCVLDCFGATSQYQWLQKHAAEYGFIQRYYAGFEAITGYKAEEWHYRYVGPEVAKDMKVKNIKTLEQYWKIAGGLY